MLVALLGLGAALASGPEVWAALHDARLASAADRDSAAAIAIYETVLEFLADDDPIRGQMTYWLARERALEGEQEAAIDLLAQAALFADAHDAARSLRAMLLAQRNPLRALPYRTSFDEGTGVWLRGWPDGDETDLSVGLETDPADPVLSWSVSVNPGRDDFIALPLAMGQVVPSSLRLSIMSLDQPSWLRVVFRDDQDRRWTSRVLSLPSDEWTSVALKVSELIRADAPFSEEKVDPTRLRRMEVRDVTAFHSDVRGAHRILLDDVVLE